MPFRNTTVLELALTPPSPYCSCFSGPPPIKTESLNGEPFWILHEDVLAWEEFDIRSLRIWNDENLVWGGFGIRRIWHNQGEFGMRRFCYENNLVWEGSGMRRFWYEEVLVWEEFGMRRFWYEENLDWGIQTQQKVRFLFPIEKIVRMTSFWIDYEMKRKKGVRWE